MKNWGAVSTLIDTFGIDDVVERHNCVIGEPDNGAFPFETRPLFAFEPFAIFKQLPSGPRPYPQPCSRLLTAVPHTAWMNWNADRLTVTSIKAISSPVLTTKKLTRIVLPLSTARSYRYYRIAMRLRGPPYCILSTLHFGRDRPSDFPDWKHRLT